jgi:DNA-binding NarL/FixJ family response regulator
VLLMDVRMPGGDGPEAIAGVLEASPRTRVVMLTTFDVDNYVYDSLRAGASGFLVKDVSPEQLITGVRSVMRGDMLIAASITRRLIEGYVGRVQPDAGSELLNGLTDREREVFRELARGLSNAEIGRRLHVSEGTVKTHVSRLLAKLGLRDRVQAVIAAYELGFVEPGGTPGASP